MYCDNPCGEKSIYIHVPHRIIHTIRIRTNIIILLRQRVNPVPTCSDGIILPRPVVVGVQAVHPVELLAVVPAGLEIVVRGAVAELRAERIVVHALHDIARVADTALDHLADVAEMVTVVIVEDEVVLAVVVRVSFRLAVALVELESVDAPVPQREPATEEAVHGVSAQYLPRGKLPGAADGDAAASRPWRCICISSRCRQYHTSRSFAASSLFFYIESLAALLFIKYFSIKTVIVILLVWPSPRGGVLADANIVAVITLILHNCDS